MANYGSFDEMIAESKKGPFDFTKNGECSNCGQCCSNFLPIAATEMKEIIRYVKKHKIREQHAILPTAEPSIDLTCPFRSEVSKSCLIYPVRPTICRMFMCNQDRESMRKNKELMHKKYYAVDMRSIFYGHDDKMGDLVRTLGGGGTDV